MEANIRPLFRIIIRKSIESEESAVSQYLNVTTPKETVHKTLWCVRER